MHSGWGSHGNYDLLLKKAPDLKLLLAHAGIPLYSETWNNIKQYKNVYIDLSQTSYLNDRMTKDAVDFLGVEKCLFGTDGPYGVHGSDDLFDVRTNPKVLSIKPQQILTIQSAGNRWILLSQ